MGNPGSRTSKFIKVGLAAYVFKVCGSTAENMIATRIAADRFLIMQNMNLDIPKDSTGQIDLFLNLQRETKKSMPIEWSSNLIVDSINKVSGNITVSPNDSGIKVDFGNKNNQDK